MEPGLDKKPSQREKISIEIAVVHLPGGQETGLAINLDSPPPRWVCLLRM